jgi:hypothetical protein
VEAVDRTKRVEETMNTGPKTRIAEGLEDVALELVEQLEQFKLDENHFRRFPFKSLARQTGFEITDRESEDKFVTALSALYDMEEIQFSLLIKRSEIDSVFLRKLHKLWPGGIRSIVPETTAELCNIPRSARN